MLSLTRQPAMVQPAKRQQSSNLFANGTKLETAIPAIQERVALRRGL